MAMKKTQYVLVPAAGLSASEQNPKQMQFFHTLHATSFAANRVQSVSTEIGALPVRVLDSIGESKPKLIEAAPEDLAALRASHPSVRILPVVYFQRAVMRYEIGPRVGLTAAKAKKAVRAGGGISITITSSKDGAPVAGALVVAFTNFAQRAGAQGTTNAHGRVTLALGGSSKRIERLYVYPPSAVWPGLKRSLTLKSGMKIPVTAIDLSYVDGVRHYYVGADLTFGQGVTVGVIDSGVAINHPGLVVAGGQNTVPGEQPGDFGDNGTEGHGTHVAGIIASRGTPPKGIRGVAPGVTLRSYRVFPQGGDNASNYSIAKAIDAGVADGCDLLNMSLGGGSPDTLTEEALTAAHDAGVVVFAANGNDDRQPVSFPAAFSMCQAVSAMGRKGTFPKGTEPYGSIASPYGKDRKNFVASFSNIGSATDLTGPGVGVISTVPAGFGVMSGTSMATPAETGAAARLLATHQGILSMPRDQNRAAAMISALAAACKRLGFGAIYEGKGMIRV